MAGTPKDHTASLSTVTPLATNPFPLRSPSFVLVKTPIPPIIHTHTHTRHGVFDFVSALNRSCLHLSSEMSVAAALLLIAALLAVTALLLAVAALLLAIAALLLAIATLLLAIAALLRTWGIDQWAV